MTKTTEQLADEMVDKAMGAIYIDCSVCIAACHFERLKTLIKSKLNLASLIQDKQILDSVLSDKSTLILTDAVSEGGMYEEIKDRQTILEAMKKGNV